MYLKKIYANGFKSFADKTEIVVEKGITAVVGPNGSGKSNISDAIKWVLGEQSAKSLRGGKMDDIIFAGTEKRMPLGYAEVNLIFDNETGIMPVEYKEVAIKRKLYRTGESEYYINKHQCRLKDIKELFMDTGIGRDGYSFIGQGRVEDILSPNSETRRQVFEEAAGIVKYKARKEEALRKLEKTNENLDRVEDIVHELSERIEPLKAQSEAANKYIELKNNLKKCELNYFVHEYEKHDEQLVILENQKNHSIEEKEKLQRKRDALEETIKLQKNQIIELQKKCSEFEKILNDKNREFESYSSLCNVHNEKRLLYKSNIQNVNLEIEELDKRNLELQNTIDKINSEKKKLIEILNSHNEKSKSINEDIEIYKSEIDKYVKIIESKRNELFELHKEINKHNSSKSTMESFIKNDQERIEQLSKEIKEEEEENKIKEEIISELIKDEEKTKLHLSLIKESLNETITLNKDNYNKKSNLEIEIKSLNEKQSHTKSKLNILSNMEAYYDGYYKSIKILMNNKDKNEELNKSIIGTVADIINTEKQYETAIEIALGSSIQNVIVNTEKEAGNIINYLKQNKIGRVTFLPIDMISERSLNSNEKTIISDPCVINTADKLVDTDLKFDKVIKHLLGRILVVDNLNNGFKISKKLNNSLKIVTLQGDVINAGGSVTGGHIAQNQNLLGRKREIEELKEDSEKQINELKEKNNELSIIDKGIKENNIKIENIKIEINENSNKLNMTDSKKKMLLEQVEKTSLVIQKYNKEKQYIVNERIKNENNIEILQNQILKIRKNIELTEASIEDTASLNEKNKEKYDEFNLVISKQKDDLHNLNQEIMLKEEKANNIISEIKRNNMSKITKQENLIIIENEINKASNSIDDFTEKQEILNAELIELKQDTTTSKEKLLKFQEEIYDYQNKINETNKALTTILDDENSMNVKIERGRSRLEDVSTKLWEDYEMNYAMALSYKDDSISYNKLYTELNNYKKAIKDLGNININSIEEYKEVKERYDFLTSQKKDLNDAKNQLERVIKELELQMKDKFLEEFTGIRAKFNEVFKQLFNGGSGDVYIEDEENALNSNIEIAVQPPGKKLSKISLLSGGEKSLTAIALLFAILKTKPTPFCILDEIEAALDDINIFRFSQYLKEFSKETQFIVITHRKGTMEAADTMYGATMEEKGVTKLVSLKLSEVDFE